MPTSLYLDKKRGVVNPSASSTWCKRVRDNGMCRESLWVHGCPHKTHIHDKRCGESGRHEEHWLYPIAS